MRFPSLLRRRALPAVLAAAFPLVLQAADAPPLTEDAFLAEVPIVLSATRLSQPRGESPAAIAVIDRQMIEASGALNIPDLLRLVPGFQVGHVFGHWSVVTYHGFSDDYARRMQVLIDGRSIYTPLFGGVYWTDIPLAIEDIDRIEVIRGPNGVTYGANAFASVINIITRTPAQDSGVLLNYTKGDSAREGATRHGTMRYAGGSDNFRYRVTAGYHGDDGFAIQRFPDGQHKRHLNFRGDYRVNARDTLDIQAGFLNGEQDEGDINDTYDPPHLRKTESGFQQLRWRRTLAPEEELSVQFYRDVRRVDETYIGAAGTAAQATLSEGMRTERWNLELQHSVRLSPEARLVWGGELRRDTVTAPLYFSTAAEQRNDLQRLFATYEWRFAPGWITNLGAMYENNDVSGSDVSPRLAVNHEFAPGQTWRAGYSRAWRTPSMFEQYAKFSPCFDLAPTTCIDIIAASTTLVPERIDSYELGYFGIFRDKHLTLDVKLFHENVVDLIAAVREDPYPQPVIPYRDVYRNSGDAQIHGIEVQADWRPTDSTRLVVSHSYAHQRGTILVELPDQTMPTDASTPVHTTSALLMQRLPAGFEASVGYYRVSNMQWLGHYADIDRTRGYTSYDARLAYKYRAGGVRGTIAVVGQNILQPYRDFWHYTTLDQRYFVTLGFEY